MRAISHVAVNVFRESVRNLLARSPVLTTHAARDAACASSATGPAPEGCPGMALAVHGDATAEDPHCPADHLAPETRRSILDRQRSCLPPTFEGEPASPAWSTALRLLDSLRRHCASPPTARELEGVLASGRDNEVSVTGGELQAAADAVRCLCGLESARDTERWFQANGVSPAAFHDYLVIALVRQKVQTAGRGG